MPKSTGIVSISGIPVVSIRNRRITAMPAQGDVVPVLPTEQLRRSSGFVGALAKIDHTHGVAGIRLQPRGKIE